MMDIREDLKAYVDGELAEARRLEVEAAVSADPLLQREVDLLRRLSIEIPHVAHDVDVVGATETLARLRRRRTPFWAPLAGAAACLLLAMVLYPNFAAPFERARSTGVDVIGSERSRTAASAPAMKSTPSISEHEARADTGGGKDLELFERKKEVSRESTKSKQAGGGFAMPRVIERTITVASVQKAYDAISKLGATAILEKADRDKDAAFANVREVEQNDTVVLLVRESDLSQVLSKVQAMEVRSKGGGKAADMSFQAPQESLDKPQAGPARPASGMVTLRIRLKLPSPIRDPR